MITDIKAHLESREFVPFSIEMKKGRFIHVPSQVGAYIKDSFAKNPDHEGEARRDLYPYLAGFSLSMADTSLFAKYIKAP